MTGVFMGHVGSDDDGAGIDPDPNFRIEDLFDVHRGIERDTDSYIEAICAQAGHGLKFAKNDAHTAMSGGKNPAPIHLPVGHYVTAKSGFLGRSSMDAVKLEAAVYDAFLSLDIKEPHVVRTSSGVWIDNDTILAAWKNDPEADRMLFAGVETRLGGAMKQEISSQARARP